jgi:hypothetical protein
MLENGLEECTCKKKSCKRHGKCAECIEFHKTNRYEPYCKRKKKVLGLFSKYEK